MSQFATSDVDSVNTAPVVSSSARIGILHAVRYVFTVNGPYDPARQFITNVMSSDRFMVTVDEVNFTPSASNASVGSPSILILPLMLLEVFLYKRLANLLSRITCPLSLLLLPPLLLCTL